MDSARAATEDDVHAAAQGMPHVTREAADSGVVAYQVGGKTFVFFRNPRPDAVDPETGERYQDVIVIWVDSEAEKLALVQDTSTPFFTTDHFTGHLSVLVRASRLGEVTREEISELIQDAWLSRTSRTRARKWLADHREVAESHAGADSGVDVSAYALAKPGAWPDEPWEGDQVAKVGDKIFAFLGDGKSIGLKCGASREEANQWLDRYPDQVSVMAYIGRHGWNTITLDGVPDDEITEAIDYSYDLVVAKLPKSKRPTST